MLDPFDLRVTGFSTAPGTTIGIVDGDEDRQDGRASTTDLKYALDDGKLEGTAQLAGFDLTVIQPYLDRYTKMDLLSGLAHERPRVDAARRRRLRRERHGPGRQAPHRGQGPAGRLHQVGSPARRGLQLRRPHARSCASRRSRMRAPYARVIIAKDETINVVEIMTPAKPAPAYQPTRAVRDCGRPAAAGHAGPHRYRRDRGRLAQFRGLLDPAELRASASQQLNGSIVGLSSDEASRAKLDLEGKVDRYAPATIDGEMNLLSATLFTNIHLKFAGVDMTSVTPYSGPLRRLQDREGQALDRRHLPRREPRARREAEVRHRPAPARREGRQPRRRLACRSSSPSRC